MMDGAVDDKNEAVAIASSDGLVEPRRYGAVNWLGLLTLYKREVRRFMKVATQTLLAPVVSALLFMVVFKLAFPGRGDINGISFGDFIAPGIVMMAILNNAFQNSSSSMIVAKVQGNTVDFLMPPLSALELTLGFLAGAATRGVLVGIVTLIFIGIMGAADVSVHSFAALIYFALVASVLMGAVGLIGGIWAEKFDHLAAIGNFVILPLSMLSGTFYPVDVLSEPFYTLSHFNPFFFLIDGFRYAFTGYSEGDLQIAVACSFGITAVLVFTCWRMLKSGYRLKA